MSETSVDDLMALDLEYRLTVGYRIWCECAPYLLQIREVLLPEVLRIAAERDEDPVDFFASYARKVHARHEAGLPLTTHEATGDESAGARGGETP